MNVGNKDKYKDKYKTTNCQSIKGRYQEKRSGECGVGVFIFHQIEQQSTNKIKNIRYDSEVMIDTLLKIGRHQSLIFHLEGGGGVLLLANNFKEKRTGDESVELAFWFFIKRATINQS